MRNPLGILRVLLIMRMKGIRSLRELTRILDVDRRLRRLCLIHGDQRRYTRSVVSRFTRRVGADVLHFIIEEKVIRLLRSRASDVDMLLDTSFVKAWSIRHPDNSRKAYSAPRCAGGEERERLDLGYKLHVAMDHRTMLHLAAILTPANDNEKKHAPSLVEKVRTVLGSAGAKLRSLVVDSPYSSRAVRELVGESVIPHIANQGGESWITSSRTRKASRSRTSTDLWGTVCAPSKRMCAPCSCANLTISLAGIV